MRVEQLGPAACRSYLLRCDETARALLVDPLRKDVDRVRGHLEHEGLQLELVVDTHTHADHLSGGALFAEQAGVPYAIHESSETTLANERLRDGQELQVGRGVVRVLHTPGHTPCSISLSAGNDLLTGDFLFLAQDGAGRLDLPGGDAGAHWDSLQRLTELGDDVSVHPGHDYQELTDATLAVERRRNPRFQRVSREEYVAWQRAVARETPAWMLEVIATNLGTRAAHEGHHGVGPDLGLDAGLNGGAESCPPGGGTCAAGPLAAMPMIFPEQSHARRSATTDGPFLLDVREPWEFGAPHGRHAPGAVLVPLGSLPGRLDELPQDRDAELHIICKSGGRSASAAAFLIDRGWRRVFNVATGTDGWVAAGLPTES